MAKNPVIDQMAQHAGLGVSDQLLDYGYWLPDGLAPWVVALIAIDKRGDKEPLLQLLESETPLPLAARRHLADLLRRYNLKKKQGNQATPTYDVTEPEARLLAITNRMRTLVDGGLSEASALDQVCSEFSIKKLDEIENINAAYRGRLGSFRRMIKRLFG